MVGGWNINILQPPWMAQQLFEPAGKKFDVEMAVGAGMQLRVRINDLYILPGIDRIIFNPVREDEDLFSLADTVAAKLFEILPHTPIDGIGYNFAYSLDDSENFAISDNFKGENRNDVYNRFNASATSATVLQHSVLVEVFPIALLNIIYKYDKNSRVLTLNYHYQLDCKRDKIKSALNHFTKCYLHSKTICRELII